MSAARHVALLEYSACLREKRQHPVVGQERHKGARGRYRMTLSGTEKMPRHHSHAIRDGEPLIAGHGAAQKPASLLHCPTSNHGDPGCGRCPRGGVSWR